MNNEQINELIKILGEENIARAFEVTGEEKISFSLLRAHIRRRCIAKAVASGGSFSTIAKRFAVSRMTVYRIFHRVKKKC